MNRSSRYLSFICLIFLLSLILLSCTTSKEYYEEKGSVFHTYYIIRYEASKVLTEKIDAELQAFNLSLNPFNPNSILAKVNRNDPVEVDQWFTDVFNKSQEIYQNTNGLFDPTVAPLINLWGFGFNKVDSITPQVIDSIRQFVGYNKIHLAGKTVVKDDPRIMLNYSAIAKGYACDVVASLLEREGVENYMVDIGGEFMIKGVNQNGVCWRLGIKKPKFDLQGNYSEIEEVVQPCKKSGLATSGDYINYVEKDGKRYAHTMNPLTGYPAAQNILSSTVLANNCMTADGYATAFMAMGFEEALKTAKQIPEIEYFFIYTDDEGIQQVAYSPGMIPFLPNRQTLSVLENP